MELRNAFHIQYRVWYLLFILFQNRIKLLNNHFLNAKTFSVTLIIILVHYNESIGCCDEDGLTFAPRYIHPSCMPIAVPLKDKFYKTKRVQCMNYVRSITALRPDCSMGHREQVLSVH